MSESFGPGEWDDRKVRHTFIRKVRRGLGGHCPRAPWAVGMGWGRGAGGQALSAPGTHSHGDMLPPSNFFLALPCPREGPQLLLTHVPRLSVLSSLTLWQGTDSI